MTVVVVAPGSAKANDLVLSQRSKRMWRAEATTGGEVATWWDNHKRGTNDRPRPGTKLRLVDGLGAIVLGYEGCWPVPTFPVWIDGDKGSRIIVADDVKQEL